MRESAQRSRRDRSLRRFTVLGSALLALLLVALPAEAAPRPADANSPPSASGYHNYDEMVSHIHAVAKAHPDIVKLFSIGKSYQGRILWATKISDNVDVDENEPEVLLDGLHHAREHLSAEM